MLKIRQLLKEQIDEVLSSLTPREQHVVLDVLGEDVKLYHYARSRFRQQQLARGRGRHASIARTPLTTRSASHDSRADVRHTWAVPG
mgnify:CR=1 FL=1